LRALPTGAGPTGFFEEPNAGTKKKKWEKTKMEGGEKSRHKPGGLQRETRKKREPRPAGCSQGHSPVNNITVTPKDGPGWQDLT